MQDGFQAASSLAIQEAEKLKQQNQQQQETAEQKTARETQEAEKLKQQQQSQSETPEQKAAKEAEAKKIADDKAAAEKNKGGDNKVDAIAELLKETNFESKEALIEHLKKKDKKTESPEEQKRSKEVYRANLNSFAVENGLLTNEDIVKLEVLKAKADKELIYEKFAGEVKDEIEDEIKEINPQATKEEIEEKIKEAFDKEYPLESKNQKAKTRAENKIKREAADLRKPLESSFTEAKTRYDEETAIRNDFPDYQKTLKKVVGETIPKSVSFFKDKDGEEEVPVDIEVPEKDQQEILKSLSEKLSTPENYLLFKEGKIDKIKQQAQDEIDYLTFKKYGEQGKKKIAEVFLSRGLDKGSKVGAEQSFATNQGLKKASDKKSEVSSEQQVIDSTRAKS